jgi:hypothetical protein
MQWLLICFTWLCRSSAVYSSEHMRRIHLVYHSTWYRGVITTSARMSNLRPPTRKGAATYRCTSHAGCALGRSAVRLGRAAAASSLPPQHAHTEQEE